MSEIQEKQSDKEKCDNNQIELKISDEQITHLISNNEEEKYKIENKEELKKLIESLFQLKILGSSVSIDDEGHWNVPNDLPAWEDTQNLFVKLNKSIKKITAITDEIIENPLAMSMMHGNNNQYFVDFCRKLAFMPKVTESAINLKGSKGKREFPDWYYAATEVCKIFWYKHTENKPKKYFELGEFDLPGNSFTKWFCDVMKIAYNLNKRECMTVLGKSYSYSTKKISVLYLYIENICNNLGLDSPVDFSRDDVSC